MRSFQLLVPRRRALTATGAVSAFESETQALFLRTRPYSEHAILHVLVSIIVISIALMAFTKLDRVVSGGGRLVPSEGKLYVEPLQKAIVREIHVKVGDLVSKGQILATLDPTFASADLAQLTQKVASAEAEASRLQAEQDGKAYRPASGNAYEVLQQSIFQQRQSEYRSSLADFDARIRNAETSINRLQKDAAVYRQRLKIASEVEEMNITLERKGWNSKLRTMAASDNRMEMERMLSEALNQIAENQHTANALRAQRAVYVERWHSDSGRDLVTARNTLEQAQQDLVKAQKLRDLVNVEAPADAIVLKISKASVGSVSGSDGSPSSEPLFTLARLDSPIEAEIDVDSKDIGFIQPGDPAEIKLDAYRFLAHGTAKGAIKTISEGSFTTDENNTPRPPYFKALITPTDIQLRNVPPSFRLIPGMTLTADIVVGKRSILSYLVEGALRTGSEAMREP